MAAVFCRLPDVPVMVMTEVPAAAELDAVRVSVPPFALTALKDAVTPWGSPEAARATVSEKPFCELMAMALAPASPGVRLRLAGVAERVNDPAVVMVSAILAVPVRLPEAPVMVTVEVAAAAELVAVNVSVLLVVALAGLKDAVTPEGNPDMARLTAPLKPCCGATLITATPLVPAGMESVDTDEDKLNPGALEDPLKALIRGWPAGLPHPVARS